jgi:nitrogen regulatory protein P-II 1
MRKVSAYIKPHRLDKIVEALQRLPRFPGFTVLDAHGQGHGRGRGGHYAYGQDGLLYHAQRVVMVLCEDDEADGIAEAMARAAHSGDAGDGLVTIEPVLAVRRIRAAGGEA